MKRTHCASSSSTVPPGVGAFVWEVVKIFALAMVVIIPIRLFLFQPFVVNGASMEPNYHSGEYLIINEIGYKEVRIGDFILKRSTREFRRGDTVVFRFPQRPGTFFIKRVVALPGERITVRGGVVTIYNELHPEGMVLEEPYLSESARVTTDDVSYTVGEDEYFVMGDNRNHSYDSRAWGPLPKRYVMGKAVVRLYPVTRAGAVN